jgi:hypothetical protein
MNQRTIIFQWQVSPVNDTVI